MTRTQTNSTPALDHRLGYFSLGLGITRLLASEPVAQTLGLSKSTRALIKWLGAREFANGVALLSSSQPLPWLQVRVLGDAVDLSLLFAAFTQSKNKKILATAVAMVAAVTAADIYATTVTPKAQQAQIPVAVVINRPPVEVEKFWNDKKSAACELGLKFEYAHGGRGTLVSTTGETGDRSKVRERLRHLKRWIETGEILPTYGQPLGLVRRMRS